MIIQGHTASSLKQSLRSFISSLSQSFRVTCGHSQPPWSPHLSQARGFCVKSLPNSFSCLQDPSCIFTCKPTTTKITTTHSYHCSLSTFIAPSQGSGYLYTHIPVTEVPRWGPQHQMAALNCHPCPHPRASLSLSAVMDAGQWSLGTDPGSKSLTQPS